MRLSAPSARTPVAILAVATCATLVAIGVWLVSPGTRDVCALPAGTATLAPVAQGEIARHVMACRDLEHGRISRDDYRMMIGAAVPPTPPVETVQWASSVRAVSSEYSATSWSAQQVLGPPNVYPANGDNANAWASREADAANEFIEVGFAQPMPMRELQIFETYNPGAIASVETIDVLGRHATLIRCGGTFTTGPCDAPEALRGTAAQITKVPLACGAPIAAVRVTLSSGTVPGWNELDAIGGVPCAMQ
jgi:hypothetical protein